MSTSKAETAQRMNPVAAFQAVSDGLSLICAGLSVVCLVSLTTLVLTEIVVASLSKIIPWMPTSIHIGWEYSGYLMGACFILGSGLTFRAGVQIRVEALLKLGKGRQAWALELVSSSVGAITTTYLAYALFEFTLRTYGYGEVSQESFTPLWIPQSILTLGAVILAIQMIARLLTCIFGGPLHRHELGATSAVE